MDSDSEDTDVSSESNDDLIPCPRTGHAAMITGNLMLVWGGYQIENSEAEFIPGDEIWIYHTEMGKWHLELTGGDIPPGLSGACLVPLEGSLYLFGGHSGLQHTNELYQLNTMTLEWSDIEIKGPHPSPRDKFSSWGYEERLYAFGGYGEPFNNYIHKEAEFVYNTDNGIGGKGWNNQLVAFDIKSKEWSEVQCSGCAPSPRAAHTSVLIGCKVFTFGGRHDYKRLNDVHCLNLDKMSWSGSLHIDGAMPEGRSWHSWTAVSSQHIFLYGGFNQNCQPLSDAWVFDVAALEWTQLDFPLDYPRLWHTACVTYDGDVLVFAGCTNNLLSEEEPPVHCNDILTFRYSPKTLYRQCTEAVVNHKDLLQEHWHILPRPLLHTIRNRTGLASSQPGTLSNNTKTHQPASEEENSL